MNSDSVKTKLKNISDASGINFLNLLVYYGLERTIYRISVSPYADHFVLKGGILLYAIYGGNYQRATTDIDLLAQRISNSGEEIQTIFSDIFSLPCDDPLFFDISSLDVHDITEFKEYHGLHLSITAYLDKTKIPIAIDIGYGDIVYPNSVKMDFPTLLKNEIPIINAYSLETIVSEKLEAIIRNGMLNSRYKDFYDIYMLSSNYSFDYHDLKEAIIQTFRNRHTSIPTNIADSIHLFQNEPLHQRRWTSFLKKKSVSQQISLENAVDKILLFLSPLLSDCTDFSTWDPKAEKWLIK